MLFINIVDFLRFYQKKTLNLFKIKKNSLILFFIYFALLLSKVDFVLEK